MAFWLKKTLSKFLFPVPVILLLLLVGLVLLWRNRARRSAAALLTTGFLLLLTASFRPVADAALGALELRYPVHKPAPGDSTRFDWIVVLDGGYSGQAGLPAEARMSSASLARFVEGLRQARAYPTARLLFSGGSSVDAFGGALLMREAALGFGIPEARITVEARSWDTDDQARLLREVVGTDSLLLVTSASHMPRAVALFRKQGMNPMPAPAGPTVTPGERLPLREYIPSSDNLEKVRTALYEGLGLAWARLRGLA